MTEVERPRVMFPESGKIQTSFCPFRVAVVQSVEWRVGVPDFQALSPAGIDVPLTCPGLVIEDKPVAYDLEFYIIRVGEYGVIRGVGRQAGPPVVVQQVGTPLCYRVYGLNFIFHVRDDITGIVFPGNVERELYRGRSFRAL